MRSISISIAGILFLIAFRMDAAGQREDPLSPRPPEANPAAANDARQKPEPASIRARTLNLPHPLPLRLSSRRDQRLTLGRPSARPVMKTYSTLFKRIHTKLSIPTRSAAGRTMRAKDVTAPAAPMSSQRPLLTSSIPGNGPPPKSMRPALPAIAISRFISGAFKAATPEAALPVRVATGCTRDRSSL